VSIPSTAHTPPCIADRGRSRAASHCIHGDGYALAAVFLSESILRSYDGGSELIVSTAHTGTTTYKHYQSHNNTLNYSPSGITLAFAHAVGHPIVVAIRAQHSTTRLRALSLPPPYGHNQPAVGHPALNIRRTRVAMSTTTSYYLATAATQNIPLPPQCTAAPTLP
jgi:hypothetical protein